MNVLNICYFAFPYSILGSYYFIHLQRYRVVTVLRPMLFGLFQVTDFFNVVDFDIPGYTLPKIVTEMHLYAWSCAIDYRFNFLYSCFSFTSMLLLQLLLYCCCE